MRPCSPLTHLMEVATMSSEPTTVADETDLPVMTDTRYSYQSESVAGRRYSVKVERPQPRDKK